MGKFIIILPTHSDYEKVVLNFIQLLRKNWPDCPFGIVVSVTGENINLKDVDVVYNGKEASLIDCVVNVTKKYESDYYVSFLGDAFIDDTIDNKKILEILNTIAENHIEYCSLSYVKNYKKIKKVNDDLRLINSLDRYSHNFTAFVASKAYIQNKMAIFKSDLEFEKYYLSEKSAFYFDNHAIVLKNHFNLLPGITKGKWDRFNYKKLKKHHPEIDFDSRPTQTFKESALCHARRHIVSLLTPSVRIKLKHATESVFKMNFGVKN